jgi:hypothetical protein
MTTNQKLDQALAFLQGRKLDAMLLAPSHQMMVEDGLPEAAIIPPEERKAAWKGKRPRPTQSMHFEKSSSKEEDPATKQLRKELAAAEAKKKAERLARLNELKQAAKAAATPKESVMSAATHHTTTKADQVKALRVKRATTKAAPKKAAPAKPAKAKQTAKAIPGIRPGSKLEIVAGLLTRKEGCTTADVLKATDWPAVSMPQMAKSAGLKLRKEKAKGEPTRYYGTAA